MPAHGATCVVFRVRMACALHSKGLCCYIFPRCLIDLLLPLVRDLMDTKDVVRDLLYLSLPSVYGVVAEQMTKFLPTTKGPLLTCVVRRS